MNNQEAAEEQRARVAQEQRFNDRLAEAEASIAHLRHCARLQDSATAAVLERAERAEALKEESAALLQQARLSLDPFEYPDLCKSIDAHLKGGE